MQWPQEQYTKDQTATRESSPDRSSPPLYEVELTASDEDDDGSVLELVIPMHSSRYQRVPTSSPKKTKPKVVKRYFCSMICCGRPLFTTIRYVSVPNRKSKDIEDVLQTQFTNPKPNNFDSSTNIRRLKTEMTLSNTVPYRHGNVSNGCE